MSFPFLSYSLHWNTDLDKKDKMKPIINDEIERIRESIDLNHHVYDYHINLIKRIVYGGVAGIDKLDLPLMLVHLMTHYAQVTY